MIKNEGGLDRIVRVVIAVLATVWAFATGIGSVLGIVLLAVAVIMLVTAAVGFCPLYRLLGVNTTRN